MVSVYNFITQNNKKQNMNKEEHEEFLKSLKEQQERSRLVYPY